jgi:Ni/Fe-hydrogenase subunit HybB-like protein
MSHAAAHAPIDREAVLKDIASRISGKRHTGRRTLWIVLMAIGLATFVFMLVTHPQRAWGSFAINALYWLGLTLGAMVLASAIRIANGRWAGPILRVAESLSAYLPFGIAAMVVLLVGGIGTYLPWVHHVNPRQAPYLNVPFLYARTLLGLGLMWWLSRDLVRVSLRTDAHLLKDHVAPELRPAYEKLAQGWRGDAAEEAWQRDRLSKRAPQICVGFAVVWTIVAWDYIMSLTPNWVSTLFGWWVFMGAFLSGIAMTALVSTRVRGTLKLEAYITPAHFWDIGKIAFGFSIFWVYQFWSQYLVIWYANLPEETWWVFLRFEEPWRRLSFTVFGFVFLLPFLGLMNMYTKKSPFWLSVFSLIILSGMWMERHILVMPSLSPDVRWVGLPEIGITLGFIGLFGWAVQGFLSRYPAIKVSDVLAGAGPGH